MYSRPWILLQDTFIFAVLLESAPIGGASQALMNFDYFRAFYLQLQALFLSTEYQCNFT